MAADLAGYAGFGFNLNQDPVLDAPEGTIVPQATSLTIGFVNYAQSPLRVQIGTSTERWCYELPDELAAAVTIPYTSFNTECWVGGEGTPYPAGTPISSVQLVIPGAATPTPFEACLAGALDGG